MPRATSSSVASSSSSSRGPQRNRASNSIASTPTGPSASTTSSSEALSLGLSSEERGERFAYGSKAQRAYEEAVTWYQRAVNLAECQELRNRKSGSRRPPGGQEIEVEGGQLQMMDDDDVQSNHLDALYNSSRLLYLLSCSFYMPERKLAGLKQAIDGYEACLALVAAQGSNKDADFERDVRFNCAEAIAALIDVALEELSASGQIERLVGRGLELLQMVAGDQEEVLRRQLDDELASSQTTTIAEAASSSQNQVDAVLPATPPSSAASNSNGNQVMAYEASLITPASLLETYSSLHTLSSSLLPLASTLEELQQIQQNLAVLQGRAEAFVSSVNQANNWGDRASPDDDWQAGISILKRAAEEAEVSILCQLIDVTTRSNDWQNLSSTVIERANSLGQKHVASVQAMLSSANVNDTSHSAQLSDSRRRALHQLKIDEMLAASDQAMTLAQTLLRVAVVLASQQISNSTEQVSLIRLSWSLASASTQSYLSILSLTDASSPTASSMTVLGSSSSATPTTLLRCQVLTSLSTLCILRSNLLFAPPHVTSPALTNAKSRKVILDNARVYARRALSEVGLLWTTTVPTSSPPSSSTDQRRLLEKYDNEIPPGGWDAILTQAEAILTCVRAVWRRASAFVKETADPSEGGSGVGGAIILPEGDRKAINREAQAELASMSRAVDMLSGRSSSSSNGGVGRLLETGWSVALDTGRWCREALVDEEGAEVITDQEGQFWREGWRRR